MSDERTESRPSHWPLVVLGAGVLVIGSLWLGGVRPMNAAGTKGEASAALAHEPAFQAQVRVTSAPAAVRAGKQAATNRAPRTAEAAFAARAFAGPGPDDPAGPGMLPHPITAEHLRMYRDVDLLEGAFAALKQRDFARARSLLDQHASEYASGYDDLQDGLSILADCMQTKAAEARERAQRFYDQHTASTARRKLRRYCLEQVPAPQPREMARALR